jgi:hypothetical protein
MLLLISVNFDGLLATPQWSHFERARVGADETALQGLRITSLVLLTILICAVFGVFAYLACARRSGPRKVRASAAHEAPTQVVQLVRRSNKIGHGLEVALHAPSPVGHGPLTSN